MIRRFLFTERGSVALESALTITVLVSAFAGMAKIAGDVFVGDWMGRGARAAARAIALNPSADPWAVLKREGVLDTNATCPLWTVTDNTCGGWTLKIDRELAPAELPADLTASVSSSGIGQLVLVRLERDSSVAFGLARGEPEA